MRLITRIVSIDPLKALANYLMVAIHILAITGLATLLKIFINNIIEGLI